jgi:hypothetical protein
MSEDSPTPEKYAVFYHVNCSDGFGAAWAAYCILEKLGGLDVIYNPIDWGHQIDIPLLKGMHVFFFDISVDREQLEKIDICAKSVEVVDHHKTTSDNVGEMDCVHVDFSKSGAVLAWERCVRELESVTGVPADDSPDRTSMPEILRYVQDNDLEKFEMPNTHKFSSMIQSFPYDPIIWDTISAELEEFISKEGSIILRADSTRIQERILPTAYEIDLDGQKMLAVNSPIFPASLGSLLKDKHGVALVWFMDGERLHVSLRSKKPDGVDVSAIATVHGGGGHQSSAGFRVLVTSKTARTIMGVAEEE